MNNIERNIDLGKDADLEAAWASEIERRIDEIESGKAETVSWEKSRTQIRRQLEGLNVTQE